MVEFFRQIGDALSSVFDFLSSLLQGLLTFLGMIPKVLGFTASMVSYIPPFVLAFFTAGISIAVVLVIINRRSN